MKRAAPLLAVLLLAAGCPSPSGGPTSAGSAAGPAAASTASKTPLAECPPTAASEPTTRQAVGRGMEMWALLFPTQPDLEAGRELKIVIRLTGGQDVTVTANGPAEKVILPVWGPEWHGGSNFDHPGAEFGVGLTFPAEGCWRIRVVNESGVGELALRIAPAPAPSATG